VVEEVFKQLCDLRTNSVVPVAAFDGRRLPAKADEQGRRQAVSCAIAMASQGGAWYAAKEELRAAHRNTRAVPNASDPPQVDILPEPAAAAWWGRRVALHTSQ